LTVVVPWHILPCSEGEWGGGTIVDTFLTLVIALGGIATGMGAIWAAVLARRQAQVTERSLSLSERGFAEQNERVRLNLEVDLLLRLEDRYDGPQMQAIRRRAARYIKDNLFSANGSLPEMRDLDDLDVRNVLDFYKDLGYFARVGAVTPETVLRTFGIGSFAYWALSKSAIAKEREKWKEPKLYEEWEWLMERLYELAHRSGEEFEGELTKAQLREFVEVENFVGQEPLSKE
jgi:hypothetical protein